MCEFVMSWWYLGGVVSGDVGEWIGSGLCV